MVQVAGETGDMYDCVGCSCDQWCGGGSVRRAPTLHSSSTNNSQLGSDLSHSHTSLTVINTECRGHTNHMSSEIILNVKYPVMVMLSNYSSPQKVSYERTVSLREEGC